MVFIQVGKLRHFEEEKRNCVEILSYRPKCTNVLAKLIIPQKNIYVALTLYNCLQIMPLNRLN